MNYHKLAILSWNLKYLKIHIWSFQYQTRALRFTNTIKLDCSWYRLQQVHENFTWKVAGQPPNPVFVWILSEYFQEEIQIWASNPAENIQRVEIDTTRRKKKLHGKNISQKKEWGNGRQREKSRKKGNACVASIFLSAVRTQEDWTAQVMKSIHIFFSWFRNRFSIWTQSNH